MQVITAPERKPITNQSIFLAGTIDDGKSEDWQSKLIEEFSEYNITILNPRRNNWGDLSDNELRKQITWELDHLEKADIIFMYIIGTSKSPISLLEMGIHIKDSKLIVVCEPEFYRYDNVRITCEYYNAEIYDSLGEGIDALLSQLE
jgi:hypothetical protein